jgi:hypothetical protein
MRTTFALKVFNSYVEKFVEKTHRSGVQRDKQGAWPCLHQDEAFFNKIAAEKKFPAGAKVCRATQQSNDAVK